MAQSYGRSFFGFQVWKICSDFLHCYQVEKYTLDAS